MYLPALALSSLALLATPAWEPVGPAGGTVLALKADPFHSEVLLAGLQDAGLFKSMDGGASWAPSGHGLPPGSITQVVFDPRTAGTLYAATDWHGVFKSLDGGDTWRSANNGLSGSAVRFGIEVLALDPRSPSTLYASRFGVGIEERDWLFKTVNGGKSWFPIARKLPGNLFSTAFVVDPRSGRLYSGTLGRGIYRSDDGGITWVWKGRKLS